jgi:ubiquinone/menaquinone biosynthesis C-methylase UbiE
MMAVGSRSFDRAAPFYDQTRGLPVEATARVTELLAGELTGRGRCLEIGVGTGRVAWPLHEAGLPMTGIDLSRPMMQVLVEKAGAGVPFPLAQADATTLPFPDHRFGAAIASHVFHLMTEWRRALTEVTRVVRPGGLLLSSRGGRDREGVLAEVRAEFQACLGGDAVHIGAAHGSRALEDAMAELGAQERQLPPVRVTTTMAVGTMIASLEAGQWSWSWGVPDTRLREAGHHTREWARSRFGPLEEPITVEAEVRWTAFDLG